MTLYVEDYIGRSIKKLEDAGELANNKYRGKALDFDGYFRSPEKDRAINKFLANSGFTPPKLSLLKEIKELELSMEKVITPTEKLSIQKDINALKLKYDLLS